MFVIKNTRIAVANLILASVELKIHCLICAIHLQLLPVLSQHIDYLVGARRVLIAPSCSPAILGKVAKSFLLTLGGYEMAAKLVAWGGVILPPPPTWLYEG